MARLTLSVIASERRFATLARMAGLISLISVQPPILPQSIPTKSPHFEVASIKPNNSGRVGFSVGPPSHGNLSGRNATTKMLIAVANRIQESKVLGGPLWIDTNRYDLLAKGSGSETDGEVWSMLQTLLAERFKLVSHQETRDLPMYALVTGKKGVKLTKAEDGACAAALKDSQPCGTVGSLANGLVGTNVSMRMIANLLSKGLDRPVVDKTGLVGKYDIQLYWVPEGYKEPDPAFLESRGNESRKILSDGPSLFAAIQEIAGLKLEPQRGPVEVLVIDQIEKPTPN